MAKDVFSVRIETELKEQFERFCEESGFTKEQGISIMLEAANLDKAKNIIPERATEIDQFELNVKNMLNMYLQSLELNRNAEERAREDFARQLDSQIDTIKDLQERIKLSEDEKKKVIDDTNKIKEELKILENDLNKENEGYKEYIQELEKENETLKSSLTNNDELLRELKNKQSHYDEDMKKYQDSLRITADQQQLINEFEKNEALFKNTMDSLNEKISSKDSELNRLNESLIQIKEEYKQEINNLREDYKEQISSLKDTHKEEITQLKQDHKEEILELKEENKELRSYLYIYKKETEEHKSKERIEQPTLFDNNEE